MEPLSAGPKVNATARLIEETDWSRTPLGPRASWPIELRLLVRIMQNCGHPMALFWGPERVQIYNDAFVPFLGEKHPTALGQAGEVCWAEAWPIVGGQIEQVIAQGRSFWHESLLVPIRRHGRIEDAYFTYSYSPVFQNEGTKVLGALVICSETTHEVQLRHQAERARREADLAREELRGIFLQAPVPMVILTGPDHRFLLTNEPYLKLVRREVLGKRLDEVFTKQEAGDWLAAVDRVYRTGEPEVITESPLQLPGENGTRRDLILDVAYYPYRSPEGQPVGVLVVVHDVTAAVTARKQVERLAHDRAELLEREQALRQTAEAAGRARDEFLAMLGHELRNPLAPILTAVRLMDMRDGKQNERERRVIERQVTHVSHLLSDLLDVSRVARGKIALQRSAVDLFDVASKAVEMASPLLEEKSHTLSLEVPREGLIVDGDPVRLAQVLANLLTNAAKYTPARGHIRVTGVRQGDEVVVCIADNGVGLQPDLLPHLFDLFTQGTRTIDRSEGGLGLGLALVKSLVALHGGSVAARNLPDAGSEFSVRLPALRRPPLAVRPTVEEDRALPRASIARRVLVVDDNVDAAELLAEALRALGHDVAVAHDGPSALERFRSFQPEVGLLDLGLPVMDGFELARRIREENSRTPVRLIAVTGYGQAHDIMRSRAAGFDDHLTKPVDLATIASCVEDDFDQGVSVA